MIPIKSGICKISESSLESRLDSYYQYDDAVDVNGA